MYLYRTSDTGSLPRSVCFCSRWTVWMKVFKDPLKKNLFKTMDEILGIKQNKQNTFPVFFGSTVISRVIPFHLWFWLIHVLTITKHILLGGVHDLLQIYFGKEKCYFYDYFENLKCFTLCVLKKTTDTNGTINEKQMSSLFRFTECIKLLWLCVTGKLLLSESPVKLFCVLDANQC